MPGDDSLKADLASITGMGKRLKLEGDELKKYIRTHMKGLGYGTETTFTMPKKSDGKSGGGILGSLFGSDDDEDDDE